jgi:hypothetical protein
MLVMHIVADTVTVSADSNCDASLLRQQDVA